MLRSMSIAKMKGGLFCQNSRPDISDLLGRQVEFVEDNYMSVMKADCNQDRFKCVYHPAEVTRDAPNDGCCMNRRSRPLPGIAVAEGHLERIDGVVYIRGTWKHMDSTLLVEGPCSSGSFLMVSDKSVNDFNGWWQFDTSDAHHGWKWTRNKSRALATWLAESVWMDRYSMLCSWLFLSQTSIQLMSHACEWDSDFNVDLNQAFNMVYAVCYVWFLSAFSLSSIPQGFLYTTGITCYSFGYVVYAGIYSGARGQTILYHLGSWLFLVGSVSLMCSSRPKGRGCLHAYSPHRIQSSVWWGSTMFLLGSVCFACDASGFGKHRINAVLGLSCFTAGRCFFVWGSQTRRCTCIFLSVETLQKLCSFDRDLKTNGPQG